MLINSRKLIVRTLWSKCCWPPAPYFSVCEFKVWITVTKTHDTKQFFWPNVTHPEPHKPHKHSKALQFQGVKLISLVWKLPGTTRKAYFSDLGSWRILLSTIMVLQNCLGLCHWILNQLCFQLRPMNPLATAQKQKQDLSPPHKVKVTARAIKHGSLCTTESKTAKKVASSLLWVPTPNNKNRRRDTHTQAGTHMRHQRSNLLYQCAMCFASKLSRNHK